jgi:hypothetical protein
MASAFLAPVAAPAPGVALRSGARRSSPASTAFAGRTAATPACSRAPPPPAAASGSDEPELSPTDPAPELDAGPGPRDDDALPDSLTDALAAAAEATALALDRGCERAVVEILLPEFWDPLSGPVYAEEGDQQRFWKLTRRFIDCVVAARPGVAIRAIYPDAGVAAMLRNQWTDAPFAISSLNDRRAVEESDEVIVAASPDPQGVDSLIKITRALAPGQSLIMFNPRLASGDVGVGLNIRRLRETFLKDFVTTYSLRPVGDVGSVFRKYPGLWQVFVQDDALPGRYKLVAERPTRPGGETLDLIIMEALGGGGGPGGEGGEPGFVDKVLLTLKSLQRFSRSLSQ